MKKTLIIAVTLAAMSTASTAQTESAGYPITPVSFTSVKVDDSFWTPRLVASREVTIPLAFTKCEETGRYTNFTQAAEHMKDPTKEFPDTHWTFTFDDTDPYKTIEGASFLLQTYPNAKFKGKKLSAYVDSVIAVIGSGQEPDGYLYTARTKSPSKTHEWAGSKRWEKVEILSHEFYNLGHMLESAVAHYQATGKRNFLDIAIKYADCVCREIGNGAGQVARVPGHQIAEMGLCKLYLVTGDKKYLDQAKYFLDMRGKTSRKDLYSQAHIPVVEQKEAVGHAVRAGYMYSGMADVAALTNDKAYINAIDSIWENITAKKYYITGGVGARHSGEAYGSNYELPNASAYCETCAQIAHVYLNHRLFLLHGESKYYDVVERTLYNALISGVSLQGNAFFYPNPLSTSTGMNYARQAWFGCACCPSNICRFIPSLPGYVYAVKDNNVFVNLFLGNTANINVKGKKIALKQETLYPYNGDIAIKIAKGSGEFALNIRIPGWVRNSVVPSDLYSYNDNQQLGYTVSVNGEQVDAKELTNGYAVISRKWKKGDEVKVHFDMKPRLVKANQKVQEDLGRMSIERGPLVYCAEWCDNEADIHNYLLNPKAALQAVPDYTLNLEDGTKHNVTAITTMAQVLSYANDGKLQVADKKLTLIPYYAWDHRGQKGGMSVWLPTDVSAAHATNVVYSKNESNGFFGR
ncbi:MAG: glycoside hydrolase family 127 protein [Bacteroidaceae bacterium]|nr:glycoside hydrolase family 127 protein [Bacteroidaceae bacterium]